MIKKEKHLIQKIGGAGGRRGESDGQRKRRSVCVAKKKDRPNLRREGQKNLPIESGAGPENENRAVLLVLTTACAKW